MSSTPYVPYQAYKSKRHSRVVSTPLVDGNVSSPQAQHANHSPSPSLEIPPWVNGDVQKSPPLESVRSAGDVAPQPAEKPTLNGVLTRPRPVSMFGTLPTQAASRDVPHAKEVNGGSEPTSPLSPKSVSTISTTPEVVINGVEPEVPCPLDGAAVSMTPVTFPSPALNGSTSSTSSSTSSDAGPSTAKPALSPRKSSTIRFVPLRAASGTAPRTSSPLRPAGPHTRTLSAATPSSLSPARYFDQQQGPIPASQARTNIASPVVSPHSQPVTPAIENSNGRSIPNHHQRSSSMMNTHYREFIPPQRTTSLPQNPPAPPPKPTSPSPPTTMPSTPRILSPIPQATSSSSNSTAVSRPTPTAPVHKTPYRPGFQPNGFYRPRTDDFLDLRRGARDAGRAERTRLERRFEKLVELHFTSPSATPTEESGNAKGKERLAPPVTRRASSFFEIDFNDLRTKSASELWRGVLESRAAAANGGKGDIRTAEQKITPWQDDGEVSTCPHCSASFHPLTNRKHHCRLCGRIICSLPVKRPQRPAPCSLLFVADPKSGRIEEVSEVVDYGVRPRSRADSLSGKGGKEGGADEKFLKGVRICRECKPIMLRQQYVQEAKRIPAMVRLYEALISLESEIEESLPQFQELLLTLSNNAEEAPTKEATAARKHLLQAFADYDTIAKRIRKTPCPGGQGSSQERVQSAILTRANLFLQKNMFPLQSLPKPKKASASNPGLNANGTGSTPGTGDTQQVIDPDSELARILQPLLEQEALLETFIEEATAQRKFEDAKTLRVNLGEIRAEIDRMVARAEGGAGEKRRDV